MSEAERATGYYKPQTLEKALEAMYQDGFVVLRGVIDVDFIDKLNETMCEDAERKIADPTQLYLGGRPIWNWLTANTALSGTKGLRQRAHKDSYAHPLYPYYVIANVPLVDFSPENGSTEFWLGSHQTTTPSDQITSKDPVAEGYNRGRPGEPLPPISEEAKAARMKIRPPIQPSDHHRIMLGLGYQSPYFPNYDQTMHLPETQRSFFLDHPGDLVDIRAQFWKPDELEKTKADEDFELRAEYLK
ncbi:hypothetical protein N0V92_002008 [Colletotrichum tropicale]|nr:hypothetical protein N0V92_002008 [Colletotrichum tropicale]